MLCASMFLLSAVTMGGRVRPGSVLPELYGAIHGSGPDWHTANFKDHGRRHGSSMTAAEFSSLKQWYSADSSGDRPMR